MSAVEKNIGTTTIDGGCAKRQLRTQDCDISWRYGNTNVLYNVVIQFK